MRTQVQFKSVPLPELASLRGEYLESLPYAQELLLETMVPQARGLGVLSRAEELCGYLLIGEHGALIEFYLERPYWVFGEQVLGLALRAFGIERAWVKSFDSLLLSSAVGYQRSMRVLGLLVRDYQPRALPRSPHIQFNARLAQEADLQRIAELDQDVFTHPGRLRAALSRGELWVFEYEQVLLGLGVSQRLSPKRPEVDLGVAVDRPHRNRGHAVYLLRTLAEHCLAQGLHPVCGCAVDNLPSRHMGERIGFVARHRLLELVLSTNGAD